MSTEYKNIFETNQSSETLATNLDEDFDLGIMDNAFESGTKSVFYSDVENAYDGNADYIYYNVGNYCEAGRAGLVNKISVKIKNVSSSYITYRVYLGDELKLNATPEVDLTFIEEITLKSSGTVDDFETLNLTNSFSIARGQYVYVLATCDRNLACGIKRWTDKPDLGRLMICVAASDIYNSAWTATSSGYYMTPPILELEGYDALNLIPPANVQIPDTFYAVEGVEFNLYANSICSNEAYQIAITADIGETQNERYFIKPTSGNVGTHEIGIEIFDANFTLVLTKYVDLVVQASVNLSGKNILIIGDSITSAYSGKVVETVRENLLSMGGTVPTFIGTQGNSPSNHEARGGWTYTTFISSGSPFYHNGSVDIGNYKTVNGYSSIDVIYIMLGTNGLNINDAKVLIDAFIDNDASTKIIVCPPPITANQDAFGANYGASLNLNYVFFRNLLFTRTEELINEFDNETYNANVKLGCGRYGLSNNYGFPTETVAVSDRITETTIRQSNALHPTEEGSQQLGDAFTGSILNALI
ncbi:MAG: hypothetical protein GY679_00090 [Mycoplasma sp.]|nr:hypothetical protein [Mycoplasma sp.]